MNRKPILCLDFDGVIHSYTSGWQGAHIIEDDPVPGAMSFLVNAFKQFDIHIFSSRSSQPNGRSAMRDWLYRHLESHLKETLEDNDAVDAGMFAYDLAFVQIKFPKDKPPAKVSIDDRAITFTGTWPSLDELQNFKPWNK